MTSSHTPQSGTASPIPLIDLVAQYATIAPEVTAAVSRVFAEQRFVLGDEVAEFECDFAEYCDSRDAIGCNSGTDALALALMAHGVGPGDEVITTPFTFFATAGAICRVGATPVFADIEPHSFNLDPQAVDAAITSRTRAIIPVHLFGQCAEMEPLWRLAVRHDIPIIEDACQAVGAEYRGRRAGVLGSIGCFSFFPTKNLGGAGDGGIMTTDDVELSKKLRRLRVHGDAGDYRHLEIGLNSRLDALQAAVLRVKLRHLESWSLARQQNAARYEALFAEQGLEETVTLPPTLPERRHVFNQFCIRVADGKRDHVLSSLQSQKIGCGVYYPQPLHLQTCFAHLGGKEGQFPVSEEAANSVLALPIYPEVPAAHQEAVVGAIAGALGHGTIRLPESSHQPAAKRGERAA